MIAYDASHLKDSFLNAETYREPCQTSKMEFVLEYSQRPKIKGVIVKG